NDAILSRELAGLKYDVKVEQDIEKFKVKANDNEVLVPFLQENGFKSLLAKVTGNGLQATEKKIEEKPSNSGIQENKNNSLSLEGRGRISLANEKSLGNLGEGEEKYHEPLTLPSPPRGEGIISTEINSRAEFAAWLPPLNETKKLAVFPVTRVQSSEFS